MISLNICAVFPKNYVAAACSAFFVVLVFYPGRAAAMTVSDPGSYGYYVQQLQKAQQQIQEQAKQFEVLTKSYDMLQEQFKELQNIKDQVKGYYDQGKAFVGKIQSIKSQIEAIPSSVVGRGKEIMSLIDEIGDFTEAADMLDAVFGDPRSADYNPWQSLAPKYQLRQQGLKDTIEKSEKLLAGMKDRFAALEDLTNKIDSTENIKEAQDLTNVFLAQIISILSEQLALTAQIGEAQALMNFSGVKDDELRRMQAEKAEKKAKYEEAKRKYLAPYEQMQSQGVDLENPSADTLIQIIEMGGGV
ncbi:hypothetical protein [Desulfovibrio sp. JC010]|uniref:hypothetical protein n=1 Tax=Desulfovibrio sp. JC010 TaxID=2593641 RepID=UPI0013D7B9B7|nr:hypothetical protein [Desulfovibrio sp. JC010]NDV25987.1 hypothetical protein [Desulfovibrio sp. JC010]